MESILSFFIGLFKALGLYSSENGLGDHLQGLNVQNCEDYTGQNIYSIVFLWLLIINIVVVINYYFGLFNRSPFQKRLIWFINVFISSIIVSLIAFYHAYIDFSIGNYCSELNISLSDCIGFAVTTFIYSMLFSLLLSIALKWKSSNNKKIPF